MKKKTRDLSLDFRRIFCYLLALIMSGCVVLTVSVSITSGLLRTESFVQARFEHYNKELLDEVNNALGGVAERTNLPTRAYTNAIQEGHVNTALHQVANNVVKGFGTDYTESKFLYGYYRTGILNYCKENGIPITEEELVENACFAVDTFNDVVGDESTSNIIIFALAYTKYPLIAVIGSIIAFVLCIVILEFITYGRHKKFDYISISLITAGETLVVLPLFAILMKYTSTLHFMDVDVYNMALAEVLDDIMKIFILVGFVVAAIGVVITMINYRYYSHKTRTLKTEHDIRVKLMNEQKAMNEKLFVEKEKKAIESEIERNEREIRE